MREASVRKTLRMPFAWLRDRYRMDVPARWGDLGMSGGAEQHDGKDGELDLGTCMLAHASKDLDSMSRQNAGTPAPFKGGG